MVAIDHAQAIYNIINVKTSYTGGYFPNSKGLNSINATSKFFVNQGVPLTANAYYYTEDFTIEIQSTSATAVNAMVRTILKCDSRHHNGFIPNGTQTTANDYPYFIAFDERTGDIETIGPNEFIIMLVMYGRFVT